MAIGGYINNDSGLARASVPYNSYAQLRAQKNQELQYSAALTQQALADQQEQERKIQLAQQTLGQIKSLPFEAPDKQRLRAWVKDKEKEAAVRIENEYNGDTRKFLEVEGSNWIQSTLSDMQSSDLYTTAEKNKEMIAMAKSAIQKGQNLVGKVGPDGKYMNAENDMLSYYSGSSPTFSFNGSYDPKTNIADHFGKIDNPYGSKYDQKAYAPDNDVLAYLQSEKGDKAGLDLYMRNFQGRKLPFKRYSLEDQMLFNLDVQNKQSLITSRTQTLELARQKAAKADKDDPAFQNAIGLITGNTIQVTPFEPVVVDQNKQIGNLGVSLADITTSGQDGSPGLEFVELSNLTLGGNYNKYAGLNKKSRIGDALVLNSGGNTIDFNKIPHEIVNISPNVFIDQKEYSKATQEDRLPGREGKKVTVRVKRDDAIAAGLLNSGNWKPGFGDKLTDKAKGARPIQNNDNNEYVDFDVMSFSKGFYNSPEVKNIANKAFYGQKRSNEIADQVSQAIDEYKTQFDDE